MMSDTGKQTFEELLERFKSGDHSCDTKEFAEFTTLLHCAMESVRDLVPLLTSNVRSWQSMGVFIAEMEGDPACEIFDHILPLLESPYVEIRGDACDCFTVCGERPEHLIKLVRHLEDPHAGIRVKVIGTVTWLETERIGALESYLIDAGVDRDISDGLSMLRRWQDPELSDQDIEAAISGGSAIVKKFAYMAACRRFYEDDERLLRFAELSKDQDIRRHSEIYSGPDQEDE
jgi:hypothetical protein